MPGSDDHDLFEDAGPRSIFAATWFRVVLVLIVFAVIGAVSVPYILDYMNPPPKPTLAARPPLSVARPNAAPSAAPATPPQSSVPTAMPVQPAPQTATPVQPPPPAAAPAQSTATPAMPAAKAPTATAPGPEPPPSVAQAQPKAAPLAPAPKSPVPEAKAEVKEEEKAASKVAAVKPAPVKAPVAKRAVAKTTPVAASGSYWVQVGAFRDEATAKRVAAKLGGAKVLVMSSRGGDAVAPTPAAPAEAAEPVGGGDRYDVFVSGGAPSDIVRRLAGKGLASDPTAGGVVIRPSQPLRDAVALSKDLAVDGFKVQVRRATGAAPRPAVSKPAAPPAPSAAAPASGDTLYRVRVGPYADRGAAIVALRDLDAKGYKGFIARGGE